MFVIEDLSQRLKPNPKKTKRLVALALALVSLSLIIYGAKLIKSNGYVSTLSPRIFDVGAPNLETPVSLFDSFFATKIKIYDEIRAGETLYAALRRLRVPQQAADKFASAIGKTTNLKFLLPGNSLMIESASDHLQLGNISNSPLTQSALDPRALELFSKDENGVAFRIRAVLPTDVGEVEVSVIKPKVYKEHSLLNGVVNSSIYNAIINSRGDAVLVNNFSDIFAWQFDFYRDTRAGDTYQMIVERNVSEGRFVGFGRVLAAEYMSAGKILRGFYFESTDGTVAGFFDDQGRSLKNAFLKAPLKVASINSRFGMRYHPVQKILKPHNGVDYGAERGTPIMAVAAGTVVNAGYSPFNGNWVRIRHMNGYETEYLHATKLGKGIRVGVRVTQGQVIGYVGKTGLATGYHLHFGMKQNGKYVNPATQRFAREVGVPPRYMAEFAQSIEAMVIAFNRQSPDRQQIIAHNEQQQDYELQ